MSHPSAPARSTFVWAKRLYVPLLLLATLALSACGNDNAPCKPGSASCACTTKDSACAGDSLSCVQGICRVCENGSCIPAVPKCYSPCRGSFVDKAGTQRICSEEGLVDGCLSGSTCQQGSCVPDAGNTNTSTSASVTAPGTHSQGTTSDGAQGGASGDANGGIDAATGGASEDDSVPAQPVGTCTADPDCPEHQVCIQKRCYSTCDSDAECSNGSTCRKKVCRQLCDDKTPCAGLNYTCQKLDNTNSICLPQVEKTAELSAKEPSAQLGSFSLQPSEDCATSGSCKLTPLLLNTSHVETSFVIVNSSPVDRIFHLTKTRESEVASDGTQQVFLGTNGENPLAWLEIGPDGAAEQAADVTLTVAASSQAKVVIRSARNEKLARWQGAIQVATNGLGPQEVDLSYSEQVPGSWGGTIYYFGNFGDHSQDQDQLSNWIKNRDDLSLAQKVPNAFIRAWANFRQGTITKAELDAVIDSIISGSWDFDRTKELCAQAKGGVCAPYAGAANRSVVSITNDPKTAPVPSGVVKLGVALNLGDGSMSDACSGQANCFVGRIESAQALQYPNNPAVVLQFGDDPTQCAGGGSPCLAMLSDFRGQIALGARFNDASGAGCAKAVDFTDKPLPWLAPGMRRDGTGSSVDTIHECRDSALPFAGKASDNVELAAANPVPDGMQRMRTLDLVDGMMVEQDLMLIIFRESLESFLGTKDDVFSSYGLMVLKRQPGEPKPDELVGNMPASPSARRKPQPLGAACSADLLGKVFPDKHYQALSDVTAADRTALVSALIDGRNTTVGGATAIAAPEKAHYLCSWTELSQDLGSLTGSGTLSGGAQTVTRYQIDGKCPRYSRVVYFTLQGEPADDTLLSCNAKNSCAQQIIDWADTPGYVRLPPSEASSSKADATFDLTWACTDGSALCDDYADLTKGKTFFEPVAGQAVFNPLLTDIKQAFRYKFQFQNRDGQSVGFAPAICDPTSKLVPYCYSPSEILDVTDRLNCALAVYDDDLTGAVELDGPSALKVHDTLVDSYGFKQLPNAFGDPSVQDGFERLNAELLVMLGDDAYTAAFASRFDLAGAQIQAFQGSEFEAGGIDLTGVAGHEMYKLYQASQYYSLVLDRFFGESPILWRSLQTGDKANAIPTSATVTGYLARVIRASTQLSNTASEIARRYQAFNRPDLARRVIERGYARSYLESQILSQFMRSVQQNIAGSEQDQVTVAVADAQRSYRVAMLDMQSAYKRITEDQTIFGFARDYIPFPALREQDDGAFPVIMARAKERLAVADTDEQRALSTNRSFETDSAAFQGELVKISSDFEKQLGDLCGTFVGTDGKSYPAIIRYKHLNSKYDSVGDPCGLERGTIYDKSGDIGADDLELRKAFQNADNLRQQASALVARITQQCDIVKRSTDQVGAIQSRINKLQNAADGLSTTIAALDRVVNMEGTLAQVGIAPEQQIEGDIYSVEAVAALAVNTSLQAGIDDLDRQVRDLRNEQATVLGYAACEQFAADGIYQVQDVQRNILLSNIDVLEAQGNLDVVSSQLQQLQNDRIRLESQWDDSNQLTINVQAAKNDPNVRIYKNDAIINADASFNQAVQYAYRATKVFEYYTGQSYAAQDKLFLVRMVSSGDVNLTQYLAQLEDTFFAFEEQFGKPATRVAVISLRDDIFSAPLYSQAAGARQLPLAERVNQFRKQLMSDKLVDNDGNIVVPFSTDFSQLSPLTNDHKILFLEAAIESSDHGDDVGRLYVRQLGASAIVNAAGNKLTYAFPPHTAVLNPLFPSDSGSGRQAFDTLLGGPTASLFRDYRFRDLPFVNSSWQLVFNPRTESVNKDIHLSSVDDIKLYVYYTDFANL